MFLSISATTSCRPWLISVTRQRSPVVFSGGQWFRPRCPVGPVFVRARTSSPAPSVWSIWWSGMNTSGKDRNSRIFTTYCATPILKESGKLLKLHHFQVALGCFYAWAKARYPPPLTGLVLGFFSDLLNCPCVCCSVWSEAGHIWFCIYAALYCRRLSVNIDPNGDVLIYS
jgi:hypothetical protein